MVIELELTNKELQLIRDYEDLSEFDINNAMSEYPEIGLMAQLFLKKFKDAELTEITL